jgi:hypothetical protein
MIRAALVLVSFVAVAGCGGSPAPKPPPPPPEEEIVHIPVAKHVKPPEPEPPPPPLEWYASVELAPVKGAKLKRGVVKLAQIEGQGMSLTGAFDGLKPGRYHFVVHEGTACGKNAKDAGPAWEAAAAVAMPVEVAKKATGPVEMADLALMLDGESTIVGRTLVLHRDKKGKPYKPVACGVITAEEPVAEEPPAEDEEAPAEEEPAEGEEPLE